MTASTSFAAAALPDVDLLFARRLSAQSGLLQDRLHRLYGHLPGFDRWYETLLQQVHGLLRERSPDLLLQDLEREADPGWFHSQAMLGYCSYVDRFAGDLDGVRERIPYLRELGVHYLHLLPFLRARDGDNDGGFAVSSYDEVEPALGNMQDLERLTAELRAAGISLCADLVLNHVADDHRWAQQAAAGDSHYRDFFHVFPDREWPDRYEPTLVQVFPRTAPGNFTPVPALGGWVWTTFYPYQWDLNYANPAVFAEMALALLRLANRGVEAFRLDSAPYLWKRLGTDCRNQAEAHWILQALRALLKLAAPGVLLKAEAIVPTPELSPYFGSGEAYGRECDLAYHSSAMTAAWAAVAEQRTDLLRSVIGSIPPLPPLGSWVTYVRCHDDIGWNVLRLDIERCGGGSRLEAVSRFFSGSDAASFASGASFQADGGDGVHGTNGMTASLLGSDTARDEAEQRLAETRQRLLYGLTFALGGLPMLYMGDELGMVNDASEQARAAWLVDGRWLQRPALDLERLAQRHQPETAAGRIYGSLSQLIGCRRRLPMLAASESMQLLPAAQPQLLAFRRGEDFVMLGNFGAEPLSVDLAALGLHGEDWRDLLAPRRTADGALHLDPWGLAWLLRGGPQ